MGWTVGPGRPTAVQRQATFLRLNALWLPDNRIRSRPIPWPRGRALANHISPLAQVFRGMADLIDHDHTSQTQYEAVTKAAEALAARATTQQLVVWPLWEADGAGLRAARPTPFTLACPDKQPPPPTSRRSSRRAQRRPMVGIKPFEATLPPSWQAILQVGPPSPLRRQARALPQWTQGVCLDLPFTTWTQPMRPSSGRPSPSFGVARSSRAASSSG
jgi:hypothetical protein